MRQYNLQTIEIYTDGSCRKRDIKDSTGFGAWGYIIIYDGAIFRTESDVMYNCTNNQAEILAVLNALKFIDPIRKPDQMVTIYSDSAYVINAINNWIPNLWIPHHWIGSNKKEVANIDLWTQIVPYLNNPYYSFQKVKGHDDCPWNNYINDIVQALSEKIKKYGRLD